MRCTKWTRSLSNFHRGRTSGARFGWPTPVQGREMLVGSERCSSGFSSQIFLFALKSQVCVCDKVCRVTFVSFASQTLPGLGIRALRRSRTVENDLARLPFTKGWSAPPSAQCDRTIASVLCAPPTDRASQSADRIPMATKPCSSEEYSRTYQSAISDGVGGRAPNP